MRNWLRIHGRIRDRGRRRRRSLLPTHRCLQPGQRSQPTSHLNCKKPKKNQVTKSEKQNIKNQERDKAHTNIRPISLGIPHDIPRIQRTLAKQMPQNVGNILILRGQTIIGELSQNRRASTEIPVCQKSAYALWRQPKRMMPLDRAHLKILPFETMKGILK